jgi:hypothetical protein
MRLTQFGHHVPRKNSRMSRPLHSNSPSGNLPERLAASKEKSGAVEPISSVVVRFFILKLTLSEVEIWNNIGWGSGECSPG